MIFCVPIGLALLALAAGSMETAKNMTWDDVARRAMEELSVKERGESAVYLDEREIAAGSSVRIDGQDVPVRQKSAMVFVDRQPQANWGHSCRYLLIGLDDGHVSSYEAEFPPFLRSVPSTLRLIHKGAGIPDWAIARP